MKILRKITILVILLVIMIHALIGDMFTSSALTIRRPIRAAVLLSNVDNLYLSSIQKALEDIQRENIDKNKDGKLQYVMLQASNSLPIAVTRTKNAISTINNAGIKTDELALVNANFNKELAKEAIKSLFLRYSGNIEAIISNNDSMAIGMNLVSNANLLEGTNYKIEDNGIEVRIPSEEYTKASEDINSMKIE